MELTETRSNSFAARRDFADARFPGEENDLSFARLRPGPAAKE